MVGKVWAWVKYFYTRYVHVVRGVVAFVLFELYASGIDSVMKWDLHRWLYGIAFALVAAMRSGKFQVDPPVAAVPDPSPANPPTKSA